MTAAVPKVSVVLPVWNAESTIERAVQSILRQSLADLELIIVDDGSTDQTPNVLTRLDADRTRVITASHQGVAAAANLGTRHASAPFIARMDADDIAHPERLARQLDTLHDQQLDVVGTRVGITSTDGTLTDGMLRYLKWINEDTATTQQIHALRFVELPLVNPTILARRDYFELSFADNPFPEDYDLMLRAASAGMTFGKTEQTLLTWSDSPGRLTRTHPRYTPAAFMECRRHHLLRGPLEAVTEVILWGAGQTGKPWLAGCRTSRLPSVRWSMSANAGRDD